MRRAIPRVRVAVFLAATSLLLMGCSSSGSRWSDLRGGESVELVLYEATARFITSFYVPSERVEVPAAFCLAVGRRSAQVLRQKRRSPDETWEPTRLLLSRLADVEPPVVRVSECEWNDEVEEVHRPSERPAVVVRISHPSFASPTTASVQVDTRESATYRFGYRCDLARRAGEWVVERCV